jgi:hypothetical protein
LGLSHTPDVQYFHSLVQAEEYFCLCNAVPEGWTEKALTGLGGLTTLTLVLERLKEAAKTNFAALAGRFEMASAAPLGLPLRGTPSFKPLSALLRPRSTPAVDDIESLSTPAAAAESVEAPAALPETPVALPPEPAPQGEAPLPAAVAPLPPPVAAPLPEIASAPEPAAPAATDWQALVQRAEHYEQAEPLPSIPIVEEKTPPEPEVLVRRPLPPSGPNSLSQAGARLQRGARSFARALAVTVSEGAYNVRKLLARILPEGMFQKDGLFAVPTSVLIGIAIIIPLVAGVGAGVWWIQQGQVKEIGRAHV